MYIKYGRKQLFSCRRSGPEGLFSAPGEGKDSGANRRKPNQHEKEGTIMDGDHVLIDTDGQKLTFATK